MEGSTWACFGHDDACGLRAPACFTPIPEACTRKGLIDLAIHDMVGLLPPFVLVAVIDGEEIQ